MSQPERQPSAGASTVSSCAATDCQHNEDRNCNADEIQVTVQDGQPTCGTYTPEAPKARP